MFVTAIIAAGGQGQRFGGSVVKQLLFLGGRPILERSVHAFLSHPSVDEVIVALPRDLAAAPPAYLRGTSKPLKIVEGGARRQDSVGNAFRAASAAGDVVVIHDAARPFVTTDLITRTIEAAVESGAALAAIPARDTVKEASPAEAGHERRVARTIPRETIYLAQTPQAFRHHVLVDALAVSGDATDEAALAERAGHTVRLVEGDARNIKITTPDDLLLGEMMEKLSTAEERFRIGTGYDLHRLVEGRLLVLGGVTIPFDRGLLGHSDADAICHAVTDAVLGAAGAGDIGRHFPDTDPQWKGASSLALLARATEVVRALGFMVGNVDATVIAERPKLAPYLEAIRRNLASAMGIQADGVSIKGKTNEGVGALGRGEAIAVHAVALLRML